jgi:hypothetical protein
MTGGPVRVPPARRPKYASPLSQMADRLAIIPAQWIGDRSYVPHADGQGRARRHKSPVG